MKSLVAHSKQDNYSSAGCPGRYPMNMLMMLWIYRSFEISMLTKAIYPLRLLTKEYFIADDYQDQRNDRIPLPKFG